MIPHTSQKWKGPQLASWSNPPPVNSEVRNDSLHFIYISCKRAEYFVHCPSANKWCVGCRGKENTNNLNLNHHSFTFHGCSRFSGYIRILEHKTMLLSR